MRYIGMGTNPGVCVMTARYALAQLRDSVPALSKLWDYLARSPRLGDFLDTAVLEAYDLPPRLERELLSHFPTEPAAVRPVAHRWRHWNGPGTTPELTLAERPSTRFGHNVSITDIFAPLPAEEAAALRTCWP